ncbi:MAG: ATP-binding protein, partial [Myxococcota bacterium]|nr:ATP-binding protein [Myxococcota bacterium]
RDVAYTVLRELIDNADGGRGMIATELLVVGSGALERRVHSLAEHPALASRVMPVLPLGPPVPHQSWITLAPPGDVVVPEHVPAPAPPSERKIAQLRGMVRVAQGLPPLEAVPELTVGMEDVDARIEQLFAHAANDGSVFAVLVGEYGAGKTHHLLHLEARALADQRPVLRLAVERLDEDLGNPQRHLRRLIENAVLPMRRRASPIDRLEAWLRAPATRKRLRAALIAIAEGGTDGARAAERALRNASDDDLDDATVLETLGALDLTDKPSNPSYRKDAYGRLHLWLDLLARLEGCEGPVLILDEAENLYRAGVSRAERRTALRSLGFYCGGALPRACVVLAVTPDTLASLREEAGELLDEIAEQSTLLPTEDVAMLRRRLLKSRPIPVTKLGKDALATLAEQAHGLARAVHGKKVDRDWDAFAARAVRESTTPRELLRRVMLREERLAWTR